MSLQLIELTPATAEREAVREILDTVATTAGQAGAELVEGQVAGDLERVFVVLDVPEGASGASATVVEAVGERATAVDGPHAVRVVGTDLETIKASRPEAGYLVEWDIPAEITMEAYLDRKKANAPKYAEVPETSFLRTYVREDTAKCLCFYDAPDTDAVVRAREAVSTPISRLHVLQTDLLGTGRA